MSAQFWIAVVHHAMVKTMQEHSFAAFSHGKRSAADKLNTDDEVIFYAPRSEFEGAPVQAFVALARIAIGEVEERPFPGTDLTTWARPARFVANVHEVPVKPMLEELSFVSNPRYWGMAFRRSLFRIERPDFELISRAMTAR